ncbi:hypothetical protein [Kribbella sp. NPDC004536]|uniref:hypothetical protein n=1 Tax=Kribbella sp. NPDC004536 TaxID=3364106 RepID=UPI0036986EC4
MSQVFGSEQRPAYFVRRFDRLGHPISIEPELPERKAILFTGPAGMGKTSELRQAEELAKDQGWTTLRISASADTPLEVHLAEVISKNLDPLRQRFGRETPTTRGGKLLSRLRPDPLRKLRRTVNDLVRSGRKTRRGFELRGLGGAFPIELVYKREEDTSPYDKLGATLEEFATELGRLTDADDTPILLMVDNVDTAGSIDQAGLNDLALHLSQLDKPIWLIVAGGGKTTNALMRASRRMGGIATTITNPFDIRELGPLSDAELRPALTDPLDAEGIPYELAAVDRLVDAANGDPGRLRELGDAALGYRDPQRGITADAATVAIRAWVRSREGRTYPAAWSQKQTTDAQKTLLTDVAVVGPGGLHMPTAMQDAGDGKWQEMDQARQELVARGLLREHGAGVVSIPDEGFRVWLVNNKTQEATAYPQFGQVLDPPEPGQAIVSAIGEREIANRVFGMPDALMSPIERFDDNGPISLAQRVPDGTTVLFTGPPGMGTSHELDKTQSMADAEGWISVRVSASRREPIEARIIRGVRAQLDTFEAQYPPEDVKKLREILKKMAVRTRSSMNTMQIRGGVPGVARAAVHTSWEGVARDSGTTLNELGEHLGKMAERHGNPILLMVDNLDAAAQKEHKAGWDDMATLVSLSAHLREQGRPMFLVGAGGEETEARLRTASAGIAGTENREPEKIDVRKVLPLSKDQLRTALTGPLAAAGVRYEPAAIEQLVTAAEGNPTRLRILTAGALKLADPAVGITADNATAAARRLNVRSQGLYDAAWFNCSNDMKEMLRRAVSHGSQGALIPTRTEPRGPRAWALDGAKEKLISMGLLTEKDQRVRIADPGFREWVQDRFGFAVAQAGLAQAGTAPQLPAAERPGTTTKTPAVGQQVGHG